MLLYDEETHTSLRRPNHQLFRTYQAFLQCISSRVSRSILWNIHTTILTMSWAVAPGPCHTVTNPWTCLKNIVIVGGERLCWTKSAPCISQHLLPSTAHIMSVRTRTFVPACTSGSPTISKSFLKTLPGEYLYHGKHRLVKAQCVPLTSNIAPIPW